MFPARNTHDMVFEEFLQRLEQVSARLKAKEAEVAALQTRNAVLERDLQASKAETESARREMAAEALKASLNDQKQARFADEIQQLVQELHTAQTANANLDRTLSLVQQELSNTKSSLEAKTRELDGQSSYWSSVLEAREASIASLQQLLNAQRAAANEAEALWEDQRAALKHTAEVAAAHAASVVAAPDQALQDQVTALKTRVLDLEAELRGADTEAREALARAAHLESHLREREKLLVKADKRYQELARQFEVAGGPIGARARDRDVADARGAVLDQALNQLQQVALDREALRKQFELIQEAFEAERAKRDRLKSKMAAKMAGCTMEAEAQAAKAQAAARQAAEAQAEVEQLRMALDAAVKDKGAQGVAAARQAEVLAAELEAMRGRHEAAAGAARAVLDAAVSAEAARHAGHIQELEAQLQKLASGGGPRSLEAEGAARALRARCEKLEAEAAGRNEQVHQMQHSLFVVRAHWGGLRQALGKLARLVSTTKAGGGLDGAVAEAAVAGTLSNQLASLGRDWDPNAKASFDAAVADALGAGSAVVEAALEAWQMLSETLRQARLSASAATTVRGAGAGAVTIIGEGSMERSGLGDHVRDTLRTQELTRTIKNLQEELAQARRAEALASEAMSVARIEAASATEGEAAASAEASRLRGALGQEQEALGRVKGLLAAAEAERDQLKVALEGTKGKAAAVVNAAGDAAVKSGRALEDAQASIAMLHARLEHAQASTSQVETLKARLRAIMSACQVPSLMHPPQHPGASAHLHLPEGMAALAGAFMAAVNGTEAANAGTHGLMPDLGTLTNAMAAATAGSEEDCQQATAAAARLEGALNNALACLRGAVAGMALLDTAHWEVGRGVEGVSVARAHLASLTQELKAGRLSTAAVIAQEVLALLDTPTISSSSVTSKQESAKAARKASSSTSGTSKAGATGGAAHGPVDIARVAEDVGQARSVVAEMAGCLKSAEGLLVAITTSLPEWLSMARAQAEAAVRGELSRLRMLEAATKSGSDSNLLLAPAAPAAPTAPTTAGPSAPAQAQAPPTVAAATASQQQGAAAGEWAATNPAVNSLRPSFDAPLDGGGGAHQEPVHQLQGAVVGLRGDMAALTARNHRLQRAVAAAQRLTTATARRADRLISAISSCLPLPPDLVGALRRGFASTVARGVGAGGPARPTPARALFTSPRQGDNGARRHHMSDQWRSDDSEAWSHGEQGVAGEHEAQSEGNGGDCVEEAEAEGEMMAREEREEMFGAALHALVELVASFLTAVESEARAAALQQVMTEEVVPLRTRCEEAERAAEAARAEAESTLETTREEVTAAQVEAYEMAQQAAEAVRVWSKALQQARAECGVVAADALEAALKTMKGEVASIKTQLRGVDEGCSAAVSKVTSVAQAEAASAATTAARAVTALGGVARSLQEALTSEMAAHDSTALQAEESERDAGGRVQDTSTQLSHLRAQIGPLQAQLQAAEAAQEEALSEAATLRRALRSREAQVVALGGSMEEGAEANRGASRSTERARSVGSRGDPDSRRSRSRARSISAGTGGRGEEEEGGDGASGGETSALSKLRRERLMSRRGRRADGDEARGN